MATTIGWRFDNSYTRLPELLFTRHNATPVQAPQLVVVNEALAASLGLDSEALRSTEGAAELAGNRVPDGAEPLAQAYAGHQFGHFNRLGDGRALLLGEHLTPAGARVDIQLKGSGRTPYSRGGDGRSALGPMLREYIMSEAMHALGIPTTRSLAVAATGEPVYRETVLPGAVLTRIAASHIRVGTFQYAAAWGTEEDVKALADYTIRRHYPELEQRADRYLGLFEEIASRQALLIAKWQLAGFIHGVMNTDNMAVSGEAIDYGPCAFIDAYDPATVFSSIDSEGRYAYGNQPRIAAWNLARFAETLLPLLHRDEEQAISLAQAALDGFADRFRHEWLAGMRAKLGMFGEEPEDEAIIESLLILMKKHRADYTGTFLTLTLGKPEAEDGLFADDPDGKQWYQLWQERLGRQPQPLAEARERMRRSNPAVIPRNHLVEAALDAAVERDDYSVMHRLLEVLAEPYAHRPEQAEYAKPPAEPDPGYRTFCGT
ncbi:protein adenylyltransferase SelO [Paenibacillus protaetiae]|uniref:Protein nucleotidyltransferase YdiU n=1 Tax=Paenibacillus protaetiae TaxID=2509456 RepID=A0A4V0YFG1_9BACL|nr:YdiU family protein [Paenibacillus protaetiae]QAY67591.1 YdiU family protein [Paenibacillus protaetiae]